MSFSSIIGQPLAVDLCQRWLEKGSTNPLLFYGPEGVGKRTLALVVAKALNCSRKSSRQIVREDDREIPCGSCPSCRKIAAGNHPDVRLINLQAQADERKEAVEKQQSLRIETILTERRRLLQSPSEGTWKVSILEEAHRLTADAANALLKILEEPPEQTAIFLLTPFRDRLFSTIVSRCQPVRFRPLTDIEMRHCLSAHQIPEERQTQAIELALGSPGRALHFSREEQLEVLREAETLWETLRTQQGGRLLSAVEGRAKPGKMSRNEVEERLEHLLIPVVRALHAGHGRAAPSVAVLEAGLTQLRHNVQPNLVYDNVLLQLSKLRQ